MRAIILAAGVGTRLSPITDSLPKPLIPVLGKPVIARIIDLLNKHGFNELIANTHYLGNQVKDYCQNNYPNQIQIIHEDTLTGVAGGIKACSDFLKQGNNTFAIIMGDAITDIDLSAMLVAHKASGRLVSIAAKQVNDTSQFGVICFDKTNKVISFCEKPKKEEALSDWVNTGIYLFESSVLDWIPSKEEFPVYDVAHDLFPNLLNNNIEINVFPANQAYWADLGTHTQYRQSLFDILNGKVNFECLGQKYSWGYLGKGSLMSAGCFVKGKAYIGQNCKIGRAIIKGNVIIEDNCIIEDGTVIQDSLILAGSIIRSGCRLRDMNIKPFNDIYPIATINEQSILLTPISGKNKREEREKELDNLFTNFVTEISNKVSKLFSRKE